MVQIGNIKLRVRNNLLSPFQKIWMRGGGGGWRKKKVSIDMGWPVSI